MFPISALFLRDLLWPFSGSIVEFTNWPTWTSLRKKKILHKIFCTFTFLCSFLFFFLLWPFFGSIMEFTYWPKLDKYAKDKDFAKNILHFNFFVWFSFLLLLWPFSGSIVEFTNCPTWTSMRRTKILQKYFALSLLFLFVVYRGPF